MLVEYRPLHSSPRHRTGPEMNLLARHGSGAPRAVRETPPLFRFSERLEAGRGYRNRLPLLPVRTSL